MKRIIYLFLFSLSTSCLALSPAIGSSLHYPVDYKPARLLSQLSIKPIREPAPELSSVNIIAVQSTTYDKKEDIAPDQEKTIHHHVGELFISTLEMGYGDILTVSYRNQSLSISAIIQVDAVCRSASGPLRLCKVGEPIEGFLKLWSFKSKKQGSFYYSLSSLNGRPRVFDTQLYIQ